MDPIPNELYTAFSFVGFVMCAIPFYWHLESWSTGPCLYMAWTSVGCLMQCINSIVWNNNMINRVPVYCDISTRIQVALNAAIPACSLCINRRLYKIGNAKTVTPSGKREKRRAVLIDLLIGLGIPVLQMILQYIVSGHRYNIFEDFGPSFSIVLMPPSFFLFYAWPVAIGCVSFVYCALAIHTFFKCERQSREFMSSNRGLNRSRYIRLMIISGVEMLFTIPLGTFFIVYNAKMGVTPWISWEDTHSNYHRVVQIAGFIWKNDPNMAIGLEMERWSYVLCAFIFFAFFGFADEARRHYRLAYNSLASRIGYSTSSGTFYTSSHGTSSFPHMKSNGGARTGGKRDSTVSFTDQLSIPSILIASDLKPNFKIEEYSYSPMDSLASSSVDSFGSEQCTDLPELNMTTPSCPSASVPPSHPDTTESTIRAYPGDAADSV